MEGVTTIEKRIPISQIEQNALAFGKFLFKLRSELRKTRKQIAEDLSVNETSVARWENGENGPVLPERKRLPDIMRVYGIDAKDKEQEKNFYDTFEISENACKIKYDARRNRNLGTVPKKLVK